MPASNTSSSGLPDRADFRHTGIRSSGTGPASSGPFALTLAAYVQHGDGGQLCEAARAGAHRHSDERIVAAAGCYRVELVFPALEALLKVVGECLP